MRFVEQKMMMRVPGGLLCSSCLQAGHLLRGPSPHRAHDVDVLRDGGVGDEAVLDLAHEDADGIGLDELGRDGLDLLFVCVVEV